MTEQAEASSTQFLSLVKEALDRITSQKKVRDQNNKRIETATSKMNSIAGRQSVFGRLKEERKTSAELSEMAYKRNENSIDALDKRLCLTHIPGLDK